MRTEHVDAETGVFFLNKEFGRGTDPKFKVNAYVCIYESGGDVNFPLKVPPQFTKSDVLQIFGRGTRDQSQGKGSFYMIGDPTGGKDGWSVVKARTSTQTDSGGINVKMFFDALTKMDLKKFLNLDFNVQAFERGNWQLEPAEFKVKY